MVDRRARRRGGGRRRDQRADDDDAVTRHRRVRARRAPGAARALRAVHAGGRRAQHRAAGDPRRRGARSPTRSRWSAAVTYALGWVAIRRASVGRTGFASVMLWIELAGVAHGRHAEPGRGRAGSRTPRCGRATASATGSSRRCCRSPACSGCARTQRPAKPTRTCSSLTRVSPDAPPDVFAPATLGPVALRNRTVKAATFEGRTPDGRGHRRPHRLPPRGRARRRRPDHGRLPRGRAGGPHPPRADRGRPGTRRPGWPGWPTRSTRPAPRSPARSATPVRSPTAAPTACTRSAPAGCRARCRCR